MTTREIKTKFKEIRKNLREAYVGFKTEKNIEKFGRDLDQAASMLTELKNQIIESKKESIEEQSEVNEIPF